MAQLVAHTDFTTYSSTRRTRLMRVEAVGLPDLKSVRKDSPSSIPYSRLPLAFRYELNLIGLPRQVVNLPKQGDLFVSTQYGGSRPH